MDALNVERLHKTYNGKLEALKGISLSVKQGDFFALLGPNGAGKSTAIGIITSLLTKTSGRVNVFGNDLDENPSAVKKHLGLVPQEFNFGVFEKVEDIVITQAGFYGISRTKAKERAEYFLNLLQLWDKRHSAARELSGGMKRRLMIVRAMIHEPKILILDEPSAGVDIEIRRSMWEFLREVNEKNGTTIILTTHYLEEVEQLCRNVAFINHGEIVLNTSIKDLLRRLNHQVFILDLKEPLQEKIQDFYLPYKQIDPSTLEVELSVKDNLNDVFGYFIKKNILVSSMREKTNRIEELFINLMGKST